MPDKGNKKGFSRKQDEIKTVEIKNYLQCMIFIMKK